MRSCAHTHSHTECPPPTGLRTAILRKCLRTLQEFLKDHAWSYRGVRDTLQEHVAATLATLPADDLGTVGIVDETATVKKGTKTRGVQRQWCGERGKTEHGLRLRKSELGFRHFEGRSYVGLLRHLMLCLVTLTFVAGQAAGLRGEKSRGHRRTGVPRAELGLRGVAGGAAADEPGAVYVGGHWLSPAA